MSDSTKGLIAMIVACIGWGFSPIVFKALTGVPPMEVLAHRTLWSVVMFAVIIAFQGQFRTLVTAFAQPRRAIWAIQSGYTTQTSLGFYIFPLVAVLIGRVFFADALSRPQALAVLLACLAVCLLTYGTGVIPWISLILAICFGVYGLIKKRLAMAAMISVTAEMAILLPIALLILWQSSHNGTAHFGGWDRTTALLLFSGPLTAIPMILFTYATAKLTLTSVGLISYINPTLQFFCAVVLFAEPFSGWHLASFGLIWAALALYSYASWRQENLRRNVARTLAASGTSVM